MRIKKLSFTLETALYHMRISEIAERKSIDGTNGVVT